MELSLVGGDGIIDRLLAELPQQLWCQRDPFGPNDFQVAQFSWGLFCDIVTHQRRYFFSSYSRVSDREIYSPATVLSKILDYAREYNLFVSMPPETQLFRARFQGCDEQLQSVQDLGPPPYDKATQANRMSPPGIPMFYAGEDGETAIRETANGPGNFAVGVFQNMRSAVLLDLTKVPPVPSLFKEIPETLEYRPRQVLGFLNHVVTEISRPIERDDRVHIEYVPTQIVTEFIRSQVLFDGRPIDGIKYTSAVYPDHSCYVLFATQDNLFPRPKEDEFPWVPASDDRWLELVDVSRKWVSQDEIDEWNK